MKLLYNFLKDMKLSMKSFYFYVEIGFALIIVAVLLLVVPENFDKSMEVYTSIEIEGALGDTVKEALNESDDEFIILETNEEVLEKVEDEKSSVGLNISQENGKVIYDFVLQGYEDEKFRNILETSIQAAFAKEVPGYEDVTTITTLEDNSEKLSDRLNILPVILTLNAAFMGLFIIASYIFLDKEEGTIRALAVTPSSMWQYLLGKVGVIMVSGIISGFIILLPIAGLKAHYFHFTLLLIATNLFGSAVGLFIASFFDNMTKAMGWLYMSIIILGFASVSYYMPAFSPLVIRILPSYPMLFAFRETMLDSPDIGLIYTNVIGFGLAAVVIFILANQRFKKTLTV
ncbi:ABC transporter permease [Clostridium sp. DL1XJH146]